MRLSEYNLLDLFKFEERDIVNHMFYELKLNYKFQDAFNYVIGKLKVQKVKPLEKIKWREGKNYHWAAVQHDNVTFLFRHYGQHFTIFFKVEDNKTKFDRTKYGCFTYHTNTDKLSEELQDKYCGNYFIDINESLIPLFELVGENGIHGLWNPLIFIRPKHVDVKNVWDGGEYDISSINDFIFCCDELFSQYLELFAENEMFEKIQTINEGDMLGVYKVLKVNKKLKDGYYHGVGLTMTNTNFAEKESWSDVYSLTRYYLHDVFPELNLEGK